MAQVAQNASLLERPDETIPADFLFRDGDVMIHRYRSGYRAFHYADGSWQHLMEACSKDRAVADSFVEGMQFLGLQYGNRCYRIAARPTRWSYERWAVETLCCSHWWIGGTCLYGCHKLTA